MTITMLNSELHNIHNVGLERFRMVLVMLLQTVIDWAEMPCEKAYTCTVIIYYQYAWWYLSLVSMQLITCGDYL